MRVLLLALDIDLSRNRGDTIHLIALVRSLAALGHRVRLVVGANGRTPPLQGVDVSVRPAAGDASVLRHVIQAGKTSHAEVIYERRTSPKISAAAALLLP